MGKNLQEVAPRYLRGIIIFFREPVANRHQPQALLCPDFVLLYLSLPLFLRYFPEKIFNYILFLTSYTGKVKRTECYV